MGLDECGRKWKSLYRALLLSLVAAVLIEVLMAHIYAYGYLAVFQGPPLATLALLGVLALLVYRELLGYLGRDMAVATAGLMGIGLAMTGVLGMAVGSLNVRDAALLVVGAYFMELVVAARLYTLLSPLSRLWTAAFVGGAGIFITSLPLVVYVGSQAALIPVAGNMIKAVGITGLLSIIGSECGNKGNTS